MYIEKRQAPTFDLCSVRPRVDLRYPIKCEKLQRLGWRAHVSWAEGIRQTGRITHTHTHTRRYLLYDECFYRFFCVSFSQMVPREPRLLVRHKWGPRTNQRRAWTNYQQIRGLSCASLTDGDSTQILNTSTVYYSHPSLNDCRTNRLRSARQREGGASLRPKQRFTWKSMHFILTAMTDGHVQFLCTLFKMYKAETWERERLRPQVWHS